MSHKGTVLALTTAALLSAGCQAFHHNSMSGAKEDAVTHKYGTSANEVKCQGVNSCRGTSECQTATNACKGQNECRSQGWVMMPESECINLGGLAVDR